MSGLVVNTLWGQVDKVAVAIERLRTFEPQDEPYFGCDSGGKDSCVVKALAAIAGVRVEWHHALTTVDAPETVRFIREYHPDTIIDKPEHTMWDLIVSHGGPPMRQARYCCEHLKENGGQGRVVITGVRAEESAMRAKRQIVTLCQRTHKSYVQPILDWSEADVWGFIRENRIPYCGLYDEGFKRIGCILCPNGSKAQKAQQIARWPKYYASYLRAFERLVQVRRANGKPLTWQSGQEVMDWWLSDAQHVPDEQMEMFA